MEISCCRGVWDLRQISPTPEHHQSGNWFKGKVFGNQSSSHNLPQPAANSQKQMAIAKRKTLRAIPA
jgi:hypothetical protein